MLAPKLAESVCFCMDICKVNKFMQFDAYLIPCVNEILDWLGVACFYSIFDFTKGYWQILLSPKSKKKIPCFSRPDA